MGRILAIILLTASVASAQDAVVSSYRDFSGGLNNYSASVSLAANESPELMNVMIDEPLGALTQRRGYETCGTIPSGNTATNLYEYSKNDGSRNLIVTDNATIWQTADCVNFSTITTGLSALNYPRFATVLDDLWIVNGSTYPIVWNGSSATQLDGVSGRPLGPTGKYITYWKSRVWIANTPTTPSSVFFSALVDDAGNILDPETSTAAWVTTNQIYINRDDGSPIYAMRPYRDNLYIGKETGWNRIVFESEFNLSVAKNVTSIGTKFNESVVEMDDGFLRFAGRDGIYAFDGSTVKRLSTKITNTFESLKQPSYGEQYKLWDTAADFIQGSLINVSTNPVSNSVALISTKSVGAFDNFESGSINIGQWIVQSGYSCSVSSILGSNRAHSNTTNCVITSSTKTLNHGLYSYDVILDSTPASGAGSMIFGVGCSTSTNCYFTGGSPEQYHFTVSNLSGANSSYSIGYKKDSVSGFTTLYSTTIAGGFANNTPANVEISVEKTYANKILSIRVDGVVRASYIDADLSHMVTDSGHMYFQMSGGGASTNLGYLDNVYMASFYLNGTFVSQISTATGISQWRNFSAEETLNSQSVVYSIRTGTTPYNVSVATWSVITSGSQVSTISANGYAQWKAEMSTTDNTKTPTIDSVSIGWATGDASKSAMGGINYKSRYWLAASTQLANDYNDTVIVESKSPLGSYTLFNLPLSAMTIWNGNLYGAIGNTSKIARIDTGSTDDGSAIVSYWNSRDEVYDNPIFYKTVNTTVLDYSNSPANTGLDVDLSPDLGATYQTRTVDLSASSLSRNTKKLNYEPNTSLGFRTRIYNDVPGIGFKIYGVHNFGKVLPFYGN